MTFWRQLGFDNNAVNHVHECVGDVMLRRYTFLKHKLVSQIWQSIICVYQRKIKQIVNIKKVRTYI